jgi:iron complex outermembrane recepter protein
MRFPSYTLSSASFGTLAAALLVSALAPSALAAQDNVADDDTNTEEPEADIVVTGSRIKVDSTTALASPVQVITVESLKRAGEIDIAQSLREIPALQGSDPATLDSAQGFGLTGASTLDLRQLGTDRTLVLLDGRRHVPGLPGTATVDVGSIPQALIARVDVLTGGASGVYGADAVSGVVNYITRTGRDFDGLEYRFQTGISDKGDAEEFYGSVAGGGTFNDGRGSAVFAVEYSRSAGILNGDRPDIAGPGFASLNPSNAFLNGILGLDPNAENAFVPDRRLPVSSAGSTIAVDPTPFAFPFGQLLSFVNNFTPGTSTVPNIPGTNIPVLQVIDANGTVRAFNPGFSTGAFNASGGDGIFIGQTAPGLTLIPELTRFNAAAGFDYEVAPNLTFFANAKFNYTETSSVAGIPFSDDIPIALDNPFLPAAIQAQIPILEALDPDSSPSIFVARDNVGSETNSGQNVERTTIRASGGLRWDAPGSNVTFEASYTWGRTDVTDTNRNIRLNDRYFTAIDAVALTAADIDGTNTNIAFDAGRALNAIRGGQDIQVTAATARPGDIVCRAEVTGVPSPAALFVGGPPLFADGTVINGVDVSSLTRPVTFQIGDGQCAPINILGPNSIQGAGAAFAFTDLQDDITIEQQQFLAVLAGDTEHLFSLPGGPVGFAVGFEYRRDESLFVPDSFFQIEPNVVTNNAATVNVSPTDGQGITVYEGFGEIRLPLLADLPFIDYLEVSATGRYSDYNNIGTTETFSFGAIYRPVDWFTLRGTVARAIRSPNIGELFNPQVAAFIGVDADPCDDGNINNGSANRPTNCLEFVDAGFDSSDFLTAFVTGTSGGNPNLLEETSDSFTIGGVFEPKGILGGALDGLTVIVDYYDIEIENAVGSLTGAAIAAACVDLPSTDNQFCDAIERDPNNGGAISGFTSGNINLAVLRARGIDFEARYSFDAPFGGDRDLGRFQLRAAGTRFLERFTESDPVIAQTIAAEPDPLQQQLLIADQATVSDLLGVVGIPEWIVNVGVNWDLGKLNIGWSGRFEDSTLQFSNAAATDVVIENGMVVVRPNPNLADPSQLTTGTGFEQDVNISYEVSDEFQIYGGINNLTDTEPFLGSLARPVGPRGRFFFIGVSGSF